MTQEIKASENNIIWSIKTSPRGKKSIGCKRLCKNRCNSNQSIECPNARLVTKLFSQVEGLDFQETFTSVAKLVAALVAYSQL